jgi:hypothetical protein
MLAIRGNHDGVISPEQANLRCRIGGHLIRLRKITKGSGADGDIRRRSRRLQRRT